MYSSRECQGFEGLFEAITILNDQEAVALVGRHSALKVFMCRRFLSYCSFSQLNWLSLGLQESALMNEKEKQTNKEPKLSIDHPAVETKP